MTFHRSYCAFWSLNILSTVISSIAMKSQNLSTDRKIENWFQLTNFTYPYSYTSVSVRFIFQFGLFYWSSNTLCVVISVVWVFSNPHFSSIEINENFLQLLFSAFISCIYIHAFIEWILYWAPFDYSLSTYSLQVNICWVFAIQPQTRSLAL